MIMKANELRTGNLVEYNGSLKEIGKITTLVEDIISGLDYCQINYRKNKKHWLINIQPIPLTEEWLLKFGYKKNKDIFIIDKDRYHTIIIVKTNNFWMPFIKSNHHEAGESFSFYGIKHVHQLQNLYFSLTGCELEIK